MVKRIISLLVLLIFVAGLVIITSDAAYARKRKDKDEEKVEEVVAEEPKLVHKFDNAEDLAAFEQLYVAKQATFGRMGVLQAYFAMEQTNLQEIDKQLEEKFGFTMEVDKMYDLNRETLEIKELGPIETAVPAQDVTG